MAITVRTMLKNKNSKVWSVSPQASVMDALQLMAEKEIGAVLVMDGDELVGIFSERDYARRGVMQGRGVESKMTEVMTSPVSAISLDRSVEDCLAIMTNHHFRHLPVIENNKVVGVVSIGDVVKNMLDDQRDTISGLENYIMGGHR